MAQFYGEIQGARGRATRMGHKSSGLSVRGAGWDIGANIDLSFDETEKRNVLTVSIDNGNGYGRSDGKIPNLTFAVTREGVKQLT